MYNDFKDIQINILSKYNKMYLKQQFGQNDIVAP